MTEPPGIIEGTFFGYNPGGGYYGADTLNRAKGYWVKVSQNGVIFYASLTDCGMVDYAGKIYNTVRIGDQCWLKENLNVGTMINGIDTMKNNGVFEKYCYNDDPSNCNIYGGLYDWDEMMQYVTTEGTQGICPPGWHIPTFAEFHTLGSTVNNDANALKAIGQGTGGGAGSNTSSFSALLGGYRHNSGAFNNLGLNTDFWSSTEEIINSSAGGMSLHSIDNNIGYANFYKGPGFSVRCLKD